MMPAVQTLLSGDVQQLHHTGKGITNATNRYVNSLFHAKEKNTHPNYYIPGHNRQEQFTALIELYYLQVSIKGAGHQLAISNCSINQLT